MNDLGSARACDRTAIDHARHAQHPLLAAYMLGSLVGVCCLADGADQIFARAVLDAGGQLEAVIPAQHYRDGLPTETHAEYDALLAQAATVHKLPSTDSTPDAHMRASQHMLDLADELLAIWDRKPARGYGGTADVVADARQRGMTVHIIWPPGATRDT